MVYMVYLVYLQFADPGTNDDGIEWHHKHEESDARHAGRPDRLPEEIAAEAQDDRDAPSGREKETAVLQLLGVHGHRVDNLSHRNVSPCCG